MRLKIFILSTMLITLISGVLFYKNLTTIGPRNILNIDFEELRSIDSQVYGTALNLRNTISSDPNELKDENTRIKELMDIINDINKTSPELAGSVTKIKNHFQVKQKQIEAYGKAIKDLRISVSNLMPDYNVLDKKNIKYVLDKRDFYRECLLDAYMFISFSHKDNEIRVIEDLKIISQIVSFAKAPNPDIQKFAEDLDTVHKRVKELDGYLKDFKDKSITQEMKIIARYYQESVEAQNQQNENLLTFMFAAIGVYLVFMILLLRKS